MPEPAFIPLPDFREYPSDEMKRRAAWFAAELRRRRTVRDFSARAVPREVVEDCLRAAAAAPGGANMQPWHFVVVSDPEVKRRIREAAEGEERGARVPHPGRRLSGRRRDGAGHHEEAARGRRHVRLTYPPPGVPACP